MGAPLPHSHHPPLHWGVSTQRRRVTGRGSRWPSSRVRKVQVCHGCSWREASERGSVPYRGGGCLGDASVEDDRVPAGAQRSSARDPGGAFVPCPGASGTRVPSRELCGGGDSLTTPPVTPEDPSITTSALGRVG